MKFPVASILPLIFVLPWNYNLSQIQLNDRMPTGGESKLNSPKYSIFNQIINKIDIQNCRAQFKNIITTNTSSNDSLQPYTIEEELLKDDKIVFKAPDGAFIDFELQSFKGLPRFGVLKQSETIVEDKELERYYEIYSALIELKFLKNDLNEKNLKFENLSPNARLNINGIKRLMYLASNNEVFKYYFCNKTIEPCKLPPYRRIGDNDKTPGIISSSKNGFLGHWGGNDANEFQQKRAFDTFIKQEYNTLLEWSHGIWEDQHEIGYLVNTVSLNALSYDFENQGFWIQAGLKRNSQINLSNRTFSPLRFVVRYMPKQLFEKNPKANTNYALFMVSPEKAEELEKRKIKKIFIVQKIKLQLLKKEAVVLRRYNKKQKLLFQYNIESPLIELYEDDALTKKLGEISLESGLFKNN